MYENKCLEQNKISKKTVKKYAKIDIKPLGNSIQKSYLVSYFMTFFNTFFQCFPNQKTAQKSPNFVPHISLILNHFLTKYENKKI